METIDSQKAVEYIKGTDSITFLTGAGVSTESGVPDYRSLSGVYQGIQRPEYLLSHTCLEQEPEKFYSFVKTLYHPQAKPNVIHQKIAALEETKETWVVSQNIDSLHKKAGTRHLVNFHGDLYDCYCRKCRQSVRWSDYLKSDVHLFCGGQIRPNVILYEEGLIESAVKQAIKVVEQASVIAIVGTNFNVHPFCDLIHYVKNETKILVINQTPITLNRPAYFYEGNALEIFNKINL